MKTIRTACLGLLAASLLAFFLPSQVTGQVGIMSAEECRCVDPDGNEIENCRCLRTFDPGQFAWTFGEEGAEGIAWRFADPESGEFAWSFRGPDESRARIGITLSVSTTDTDAMGARVESVLDDGPAHSAGIEEGDIITRIDGVSLFEPLKDREAEEDLDLDGSMPAQRLLHLARELEPGDEVDVEYLRGSTRRTTTIVAEDLGEWGGNVMFFGGDWEDRWDPEAFEGAWAERWDPEAFQKAWEERWDPGEFKEMWFERWDPEKFEDIWVEGDEKGFVFRKGGEGEPTVWAFGPDDKQIEIAGPGFFAAGGHFSACPESAETLNYFVLGSECIGGLRMEKLNPELGEYFGTSTGVLVADVHEDSMLGLEAGDVVLRVGDRDATDPDKLRQIFRSYEPEEELTLVIMRKNAEMTVTGTLGR